jgi:Terminase large subunit, T4likevirus-type, N-terminal
MNDLEDLAYQIDPALWVEHKLNIVPQDWQKQLLRARRGASIIVLTARQVGKTTAAAWAIAHMMLFSPGSLSVVACPAQRQSGEAVRRVKEVLISFGAKLKVENVFGLELDNGSRVLALPGSDDSIRGLTVDGWIVADEAAQLSDELIAALRPMRARRPEARFVMLSTAWSRTDPFWNVWAGDDPNWIRIKATADQIGLFTAEFLEQERRALGETAFNKEYLGIPGAPPSARSIGVCISALRRFISLCRARVRSFRYRQPKPFCIRIRCFDRCAMIQTTCVAGDGSVRRSSRMTSGAAAIARPRSLAAVVR